MIGLAGGVFNQPLGEWSNARLRRFYSSCLSTPSPLPCGSASGFGSSIVIDGSGSSHPHHLTDSFAQKELQPGCVCVRARARTYGARETDVGLVYPPNHIHPWYCNHEGFCISIDQYINISPADDVLARLMCNLALAS